LRTSMFRTKSGLKFYMKNQEISSYKFKENTLIWWVFNMQAAWSQGAVHLKIFSK
jgi:hypothetical protein